MASLVAPDPTDSPVQADHPAQMASLALAVRMDKTARPVAKDLPVRLETPDPPDPQAHLVAKETTANQARRDRPDPLDPKLITDPTAPLETLARPDHQDPQEKTLNTARARLDPASNCRPLAFIAGPRTIEFLLLIFSLLRHHREKMWLIFLRFSSATRL